MSPSASRVRVFLVCLTLPTHPNRRTVLTLTLTLTLAWRVDSGAEDVDHLSVIVLLDDASQTTLHAWVAEIEAQIRAAGVDVHVPRTEQEPFHATLGVVSAASYPAEAALADINEAIPPGTWSPIPITLDVASINW